MSAVVAADSAIAGSATGNGRPKAANVKPASKSKRKPEGPSKNRAREQQKAERAVEEAEAVLRQLEQELADPAQWASKYETAKSEARHTAAKRAIEQAYAHLETLQE